MARIAMIGATGLIGRSLAPMLVADGHELLILGRRASGVAGAREALGTMAEWPQLLKGETVDAAISTLGTTRRAAGSWDAFRAVDHDAVIAFAGAARQCGARHMIGVSSVGAEATSGNAYLALKGEVEERLAGMGFGRLDVVRPGLLRGERGADRRRGERIGILLSPLVNPLLRGSLDRFQAIDATLVAAAMAVLAGRDAPGRFVHQNREIRALAGSRA